MKELNFALYQRLLKKSGLKNKKRLMSGIKKADGLGHKSITKSPLNNKNDLIRIIYMSYAWMPKMLKGFGKHNFNGKTIRNLTSLAKKATFKKLDEAEETALFVGLAKLTNNYMVGASKVLSIINLKQYPIFDSQVIKAWNHYIADKTNSSRLRNISIKANKGRNAIEKYRLYKTWLLKWAKELKQPVRHVEFLLYSLGKNM